MELKISRKELLRGVAQTHAVADRKGTMPILSHILMRANTSGHVELSATDLYLGVTANLEAEVAKEGTVALAAKLLFSIVRSLPEEKVSLRLLDHDAVELACGRTKYKLSASSGADFPPLPSLGDAKVVDVAVPVLADLLSKTYFAMSRDETRPHLSSALFEMESGTVRVVSTDGHRLCRAEAPMQTPDDATSILIPAKGVIELRRLIDEVRQDTKRGDEGAEGDKPETIGLATSGGNAFFISSGIRLNVKLTDEQFLPYTKVIPQSHSRRALVPRTAWLDALRRIALLAGNRGGGIRLELQPSVLLVSSESPNVGEGTEQVDVEFDGEPLTIGFNAQYLTDVLTALDVDEVALELSGEFDPGVVRPTEDEGFIAVVMPMRI